MMPNNKVMFLTVGTGRDRSDIADMLRDSIRCQNPSRVVFAASRKTRDETLPLITPALDQAGIVHDTMLLDDEQDVQACVLQMRAALQTLRASVTHPDDIVVDYTSGTKPMSAAAFFSAMALGVRNVIYMEGTRDNTGRVIAGTQTPRLVRPLSLFADIAHEQACALWDMHAYAAAAIVFQKECERRFQPQPKAQAQSFFELATAYAAWDRFEFGVACAAFEKLARADIEAAPCASQLKLNMQAVHIERKDCYALHRLGDLFNNAARRAAQAAWDDAVARLYRAAEFLVQIVLHQECQIETKKVLFADLPPAMQSEYASRAEGKKPVQLGVRDAMRLLQYKYPTTACAQLLSGELGQRLLRLLSARNESVLAHGFTPVQSSVYHELRGLIAELARATWPQRFDHACAMTSFPSLSS